MDGLRSRVANSTQDPCDVVPRFGHVLNMWHPHLQMKACHAACPGDKYEVLGGLGEGSFGKADGSSSLLNLAFCEHACADFIS